MHAIQLRHEGDASKRLLIQGLALAFGVASGKQGGQL